jgi:hypothetical protein
MKLPGSIWNGLLPDEFGAKNAFCVKQWSGISDELHHTSHFCHAGESFMSGYTFFRFLLIVFVILGSGGCLQDASRSPADLSRQGKGYFLDGTYFNDVHGLAWRVAGWTPASPGFTLGPGFVFGWDHPKAEARARLWIYQRARDSSQRMTLPWSTTLREAAANIALRQDWAFLETENSRLSGQPVLRAIYLDKNGQKGIACFWEHGRVVLVVQVSADVRKFDALRGETEKALESMEFVNLSKSDDESGETQALVATPEAMHLDGGQQDTGQDTGQDVVEHVIQYPGETLALIAQWYTGSTANWTAILEYNEDLRPTALRLGQVVRIPAGMVDREEPLPESFVRRSLQRPESVLQEDGAGSTEEGKGKNMMDEAASEKLEGAEKSEESGDPAELLMVPAK